MPRATYDRIVEHGILGPDDKVELLGGRLIVAEPKYSPHATAVLLVAETLRRIFRDGWHIRTEAPLALGQFSEPEPDVCVVRGEIRDYRDAHPTHAGLVVEVAESSLRLDRTIKKNIYAAAGIADYWIVNLVERVLEVYREPVEVRRRRREYRRVVTLGPDEVVIPLAAPDAHIRVADLLP
jgi:Uma2 family endonuclease